MKRISSNWCVPSITVALLFAFASPARADFLAFDNYCSTGSLIACSSVEISTTSIAGGTHVVIRVRNLQGSLGFTTLDRSAITKVVIYTPSTASGASDLSVATGGATGIKNTPADKWRLTAVNSYRSGFALTSNNGNGGTDGSIYGCTADPNAYNFYSTCAPSDWVVFSFNTTTNWTAGDAQVGVYSLVGNQTYALATCKTFNSDCVDPVVTPEPVTVALFGTGLFGLAGAGLIRRRKLTDFDA